MKRGVCFCLVIGMLLSVNLVASEDQQDIVSEFFSSPLKWTSSDIMVKPVSDETHQIVSIKDPTIVRYNNLWHIYATAYSTSARTWTMVYLNFRDWEDAPNAKLTHIDVNPALRGYHCAPHLFYFTPHKKWYFIFQSQHPQYCTTDDITKPETWTAPKNFFERMPQSAPRLPIDYHIICDETHAYLFFTGDDGRFYRSRTKIEDFPNGFGDIEIAIQGNRNNLFEGSMTYKIRGTDTYLTIIEGMSPARHYNAWISKDLNGEWTPVEGASSWDTPFAGINNVTFEEGVDAWTRDISHGELLRTNYDETPTIDLENLQFLFQGRAADSGGRYEMLPYRLGLLTMDYSDKRKAGQANMTDTPDTSKWVQFDTFKYSGKAVVTPKAGEYANPIIAGFYPDPSICRVGEDYYIATSSFNYFPGIPIWHSKDLVNWTQIGNAIDRPSQFAIEGGQMSSGTFAPTIRYHEGTFYMINTLVGGIGNYYVTATNPAGPWSDPVRLSDVGGIDPDIFFDDDGKCYILSCDEPVGGAQYSGHRAIRMQEYDLDQKQSVGEKRVLVNGGTDITKQPVWCEAPHLYKIHGKYYLMCAQGGTSTDHTEVIFRSDSLWGPYEPWEKNPILSAVGLPADRPNPVTCTGHADLVETQNGQWYAVFLACQPYESGHFNTGRQTFMLPVTWTDDGWPVILPPDTPVPLMVKKPDLPAGTAPVATAGNISFTDTFDSDKLHYRWIGIRKPTSEWYALSKADEALYLQPRQDTLSRQGNPSYLGTRQQNNEFSCSVTLTAQPETVDCTAGLAAFQNESHYYAIQVKVDSGRLAEVSVEQPPANSGRGFRRGGGGGQQSQPRILASQKLPDTVTSIELKIEGAGFVTRLFYKIGDGEFTQLGEDLQSSFLSTETAGGFQGVTLGMFAHN